MHFLASGTTKAALALEAPRSTQKATGMATGIGVERLQAALIILG